MDDPCPNLKKKIYLPDEEDEEGKREEVDGDGKKQRKKRNLKQTERIIYAPFSNLGFLNFDKSGGYITIPDNHVVFTKREKAEKFNDVVK